MIALITFVLKLELMQVGAYLEYSEGDAKPQIAIMKAGN